MSMSVFERHSQLKEEYTTGRSGVRNISLRKLGLYAVLYLSYNTYVLVGNMVWYGVSVLVRWLYVHNQYNCSLKAP